MGETSTNLGTGAGCVSGFPISDGRSGRCDGLASDLCDARLHVAANAALKFGCRQES